MTTNLLQFEHRVERSEYRVDAGTEELLVPPEHGPSAEIRNRPHRRALGEQSDLAEAEAPRVQYAHGIIELDFLEHLCLERGHGRLSNVAPNVVAEIEESVPVDIRLGDVEVAADEGDEEGVDEVVEEFVEDLGALARVGLGGLLAVQRWGSEPFNVVYLGGVSRGCEQRRIRVPSLHSLHHFMQTHALEPPQVDEVIDLLEEARFVVRLNIPLTPKLIGDDFRQNPLAERRDTRDGRGEVGERRILEIRDCSYPRRPRLPRALGRLALGPG